MILPGSGNLFGGRAVVLKNIPAITTQAMKFPDAPYSLKMACGENPKRVYGSKGRFPSTEMGNVLGYRKAWIDAADYARKWDDYRDKISRHEKADAPKRDLQLDTLAGVLKGQILVQNHCYRSDEMATMIDISHEFGFHIAMFHHASEAYKIAPLLAKEGRPAPPPGPTGRLQDGGLRRHRGQRRHGASRRGLRGDQVRRSGDHPAPQPGGRHRHGRGGPGPASPSAGRKRSPGSPPIPAKAIGVGDRTGSLESGKAADVVLWSGDPFSVYTKADKVFLDGALVYDRSDPRFQPKSDFELGQPGEGAFQ